MNVPICTGGVGVMNLGWAVRHPPNFGLLCDLQLKFLVCIDVFSTAVTTHSQEIYFTSECTKTVSIGGVGLYSDPLGSSQRSPDPTALEKGKG